MQWRARSIEFRFLVLNVPLTYISGLKLFPDLYFLFLGYTSWRPWSLHSSCHNPSETITACISLPPTPPTSSNPHLYQIQNTNPIFHFLPITLFWPYRHYVSFSLITSLNFVFVFVTTVLLLPPRTFNFENIIWNVLFSGKQPAQKWTSSNLNQILTKGSFNKSRASPLI